MQYTQVNIGRTRRDGTVMSDQKWRSFQNNVSHALHRAMAHSRSQGVEIHLGSGVWGGSQEESAHISTLSEAPLNLLILSMDLKVLLGVFDQEAIAVIGTESTLISH